VAIVDDVTTLHLGLAGVLDVAKELEKLVKRKAEALARVKKGEGRGCPSQGEETGGMGDGGVEGRALGSSGGGGAMVSSSCAGQSAGASVAAAALLSWGRPT
jgi:hypothetical protein